MLTGNRRRQIALLSVMLLVMLAALPLFVGMAEFTGDDYYYVINNPLVTSAELSALLEIWRRPMKIEYFPVTITSYAFEFRLWGGAVKLYHLTSLLIFVCIGFAARSLTLRMNSPLEGRESSARLAFLASVATLICLAHPLNVESVASISNRKELLYVLFGLLSLRCHFVANRRPVTIAATIFFMILAQLSKGSAVILPALFLLGEFALPGRVQRRNRLLLLPVLYSVVAIGVFIIQFKVALRAGVVDQNVGLGLVARVGGVVRSLNVMLWKFIYPANISYDYDLLWPQGLPPFSELLLPLLLLTLLVWLACRRRWQLLACVLLALVALLPYSNIIPLRHNVRGQMVFYDHYLLFATMLCVPLLTRLLLGVPAGWRSRVTAAGLALTVVMAGYNYHLYGFWANRETLYRRIIAVAPKLPKGYLFLGKSYNEQGRYGEAIEVLEKIFTLESWYPTYFEAYRELGNAYAYNRQFKAAEMAYRSFLELQPKDRAALQNLSAALIEQRRYQDAQNVILQWLAYYPDDRDASYNLAVCEQMLAKVR